MIRTTIAAAILAGSAHAATVDPEFVMFHGDPEAFVTGYNEKGMPFFHKQGPYLGPSKGEVPRAKIARKDMQYDCVETACKPRPRTQMNFPGYPTPYKTVYSVGNYSPIYRNWGGDVGSAFWGGSSTASGRCCQTSGTTVVDTPLPAVVNPPSVLPFPPPKVVEPRGELVPVIPLPGSMLAMIAAIGALYGWRRWNA